MDAYTRMRAQMALIDCRPAKDLGGNYFQKVWVVGRSIFFTHNAALRDLITKRNLFPLDGPYEMEEVTIEEAAESFRLSKTDKTERTICTDPMDGALYPGGKLFNEKLI